MNPNNPQQQPPPYTYTPPPAGVPPGGSGLTPGASVLIAYLLSWVGGLIVLVVEKRNNFVRFHALQSFILGLVVMVVLFALSIFGSIISGFGLILGFRFFIEIFAFISSLVWIGYVIYVIIVAVQAASGKMVRIPYIAEQADRLLPTFLR